jgi:hypothetical protein
MLVPVLCATDGKPRSLTPDEIVAIIRQAADNTALVMPPLAAKHLRGDLLQVAGIVRDFLAEDLDDARFLLNLWAERVDEINAYAARARQFVEHEVFLAGSTPDDAAFTRPAETQGDALAANQWLVGAGAAHRPVIQIYGPWVIDRPAANTIKESVA